MSDYILVWSLGPRADAQAKPMASYKFYLTPATLIQGERKRKVCIVICGWLISSHELERHVV
jgi:hypothetical protein